ncbi:uncharacterized protein LOC116287521 [Actinia tenebrosa]|uniref:Uncharacterized protein LOC116287521 n=1 Tax=Actinia tenebrosa TaxID=6105 RepID=A0A6P8H0Z5_ACTTE|nr:uncharacterized protein LOC116287521 [Actinia tenebrosa]
MSLIAGVVTLVFVIQTVSSLHCYQCTNTNSWEECGNITTDATCSEETTRGQCMLLTLKIPQGDQYIMKYSRGCAKICENINNPNCGKEEMTCKVECCHGDYCNRLDSDTTARPLEPQTEAFSGSHNHMQFLTYKLFFIVLFFVIELL